MQINTFFCDKLSLSQMLMIIYEGVIDNSQGFRVIYERYR